MGDSNVLSKKFIVPDGSVVVPHSFDTRVTDKNLSLGRITKKQLDEHLAALVDDSASADFLDYGSLVEGEHIDSVETSAPSADFGSSQGPSSGGSVY
ncbi:hypothetical protein GW915_07875 [bacterium]|nr:hypothetical protein [bacterium]